MDEKELLGLQNYDDIIAAVILDLGEGDVDFGIEL